VLAWDESKKKTKGFRDGIASLKQGQKQFPPSLDAVPEKVLSAGRKEGTMFTGRMIDDLIETVERTERRCSDERSREEKLAHFYAISQFELAQFEPSLAGVA
jgi:hypothetical protein